MKNWINDNENNIVLSSTIKLSRNLKNVLFPNKLSPEAAREESKNIYEIISRNLDNEELKLYEIWNKDSEEYHQYIQRNLDIKEIVKNSDKASCAINTDETLRIILNKDNHIEMQCISSGLSLEEILTSSMDLDNKIEENFAYAYDEELGYLTSSLDNIGTGMNACVIMHLPALNMSDEINNISKKISNLGIKIASIYKDGNKAFGNMYEITNKTTIGLSEEEIVQNLKEAVLEILNKEKDLRIVMLNKCKDEIEDKAFRAEAILNAAKILEFKETIELLSDVRLGCELSLINLEKSKLNQVQVMVSDCYLEDSFGAKLTPKELKHRRAEVVQNILT